MKKITEEERRVIKIRTTRNCIVKTTEIKRIKKERKIGIRHVHYEHVHVC